jgi:hypothetical protein
MKLTVAPQITTVTPLPESSTPDAVLVGLGRLLARWRILLGAPLLAAVVAAAFITARPARFTATSTVMVVPPTVTTTLQAAAPTVDAFHQLATSTYIIGHVEETLRRDGAIGADERIGTFDAELRQTGTAANPYLSLINLHVTTDTPDKSQKAANAWAQILAAEERAIATKGMTFILEELPKATTAYEAVERESQSVRERHANELAAIKVKSMVPLKTARVASQEAIVVQLEQALNQSRIERTRYEAQIEQLTRELAQTAPVVTLSRSLSDEALWRALAGERGGSSAGLLDARIAGEEINPVHMQLSQQLADARVALHAADAQIVRLTEQLGRALAEATAARGELAGSERDLGLVVERHAFEIAEQTRRLEQSKTRLTFLSAKAGEAEVATAAVDGALRIGGLAVSAPPSGPSPWLAGALAFLGALVVALALVWVAEYHAART